MIMGERINVSKRYFDTNKVRLRLDEKLRTAKKTEFQFQ